MKKVVKKAIVSQPNVEDLARERAAEIQKLRAEISFANEKLATLEKDQTDFMLAHGFSTFEGFKVVETIGRVAWDGKSGKALDFAKEVLLQKVDAIFIKKTLDADKLFAACVDDALLLGTLAQVGLKLVRKPSSISLRSTN